MATFEKKIGLAFGSRRLQFESVSDALKWLARELGTDVASMTCEAAEPTKDPRYGWGRSIWAWVGEFDADHAAMMWVPDATYRTWVILRGVHALN